MATFYTFLDMHTCRFDRVQAPLLRWLPPARQSQRGLLADTVGSPNPKTGTQNSTANSSPSPLRVDAPVCSNLDNDRPPAKSVAKHIRPPNNGATAHTYVGEGEGPGPYTPPQPQTQPAALVAREKQRRRLLLSGIRPGQLLSLLHSSTQWQPTSGPAPRSRVVQQEGRWQMQTEAPDPLALWKQEKGRRSYVRGVMSAPFKLWRAAGGPRRAASWGAGFVQPGGSIEAAAPSRALTYSACGYGSRRPTDALIDVMDRVAHRHHGSTLDRFESIEVGEAGRAG